MRSSAPSSPRRRRHREQAGQGVSGPRLTPQEVAALLAELPDDAEIAVTVRRRAPHPRRPADGPRDGEKESRERPGYLRQKEAARYLGISVRYFRDHVQARPFELPGRGTRRVLVWRPADLDAWVTRVCDPKSRRQVTARGDGPEVKRGRPR